MGVQPPSCVAPTQATSFPLITSCPCRGPELDNVIANLELMPLRMNERKNSHMGQRQQDLAQRLFEAGLLSKEGRNVVVR